VAQCQDTKKYVVYAWKEGRMQAQKDTIVCLHRKNHPRLFVVICENCKFKGKCSEYRQYLVRNLEEPKPERVSPERRANYGIPR